MKTRLLFGLHMHQPTGNFDSVLDRAVELCYDPLLQTLLDFKEFRFSLHCSGWLLSRLQKRYPKTFAKLKALSEAGSMELFGGGYYEPILPSIPARDRSLQIQKLSSKIQRLFGQKVRGAWIAERVWQQDLVTTLSQEGIEYAMLDDYHFLSAGFEEKDLQGHLTSEYEGKRLGLFPISKELRYAVPFKPLDEALELIKAKEVAILFDDAEKFGLWPHTYDWVYQEGWLRRFIEAVLHDPQIETLHFGSLFDSHQPKSLAYLPNLSYEEMGEWSLPTEEILRLQRLKQSCQEVQDASKFIRGGVWENFFVKYPESNRLHKRMLEISQSGYKKKNLLKLQTNDVYWHGIFGGIYLPNLRDNAYRYLIKCENDRYDKNAIERADRDMDGYEEIKVVQPRFIYLIETKNGASIAELDDRKRLFNYQNTLARRKEFYHFIEECEADRTKGIATIHTECKKIPDSIRKALHFDRHIKNSFIDHISDDSFDLHSLYRSDFHELAPFLQGPFEQIHTEPLAFFAKGFIDTTPCEALKSYEIEDGTLRYRFTLHSSLDQPFSYALECNLHFAKIQKLTINGTPLHEGIQKERLQHIELFDPYCETTFRFLFDEPVVFYALPLQSVSQNEEGFELTDQGVTLAFKKQFNKNIDFRCTLEIENV